MRAVLATTFFALVVALSGVASARWKPQYAQADPAVRNWYRAARLTKAAQRRLGFAGCCDDGDVVKARFRLSRDNGNPAWFYQKDGAWIRIPDDIIHWDESAPDNRPTLFALAQPVGGVPAGTLTCFYPPSGGY